VANTALWSTVNADGSANAEGISAAVEEAVAKAQTKGVTIVVHSGDFDKLMAAFIIATGAAASGKEVSMFFTFWGLNALKNGRRTPGKSILERMASWMTPRDPNAAPCSRMNFFGMGPRFFRTLMKRNNVQPLSEMVETASQLGVRLIACRMSMGIMGVREAELLDDIDYGGVATYLCNASDANLNLFI
jgi:peroxiredoxin family protein